MKKDPIAIDPRLSRLAYRCFPNGCPLGRTCCVGVVVEVSRREMRIVDSLMDELAEVAPRLRQGRGFVNVFADDGDGLQIDQQDEAGTCPFLFARQGRALCSIHDTALRTARDVAAVKPQACRHWPLVLQSHGDGVRITVHPSAEGLGCVAPLADLPGQPTVREAFAREIAELRELATPRAPARSRTRVPT